MQLTRSILFLIVSAICLAAATVVALGAITSNYDAWLAGGLLSYVLSCLP